MIGFKIGHETRPIQQIYLQLHLVEKLSHLRKAVIDTGKTFDRLER